MQLPSAEECDALIHDKKLTAIVYFLDETFEELTYDVTTTILEAVEQLAGIIKLQNYTTFTLYESRRVRCGQQISSSQASPAVYSGSSPGHQQHEEQIATCSTLPEANCSSSTLCCYMHQQSCIYWRFKSQA